jgi:hypothetical protein
VSRSVPPRLAQVVIKVVIDLAWESAARKRQTQGLTGSVGDAGPAGSLAIGSDSTRAFANETSALDREPARPRMRFLGRTTGNSTLDRELAWAWVRFSGWTARSSSISRRKRLPDATAPIAEVRFGRSAEPSLFPPTGSAAGPAGGERSRVNQATAAVGELSRVARQ